MNNEQLINYGNVVLSFVYVGKVISVERQMFDNLSDAGQVFSLCKSVSGEYEKIVAKEIGDTHLNELKT